MTQPFLPSILHDPTLYRGGHGSVPPYRVPRAYRDWLQTQYAGTVAA